LLILDYLLLNILHQGTVQQQYRQHSAQLPQQQQYHAAAMASNRPAAAAAQPGLQHLLRQHDQQHSSHWQHQLDQHHAVGAQQQDKQAGLVEAATPSSSSSSSSSASSAGDGSISSLPAVSPVTSAEGSRLAGENDPFDDVLGLSSFQQQYQATLQHLHVGHTRNLSQLAQLFDPAAVLAGEEGGAAADWQLASCLHATSINAPGWLWCLVPNRLWGQMVQ
jgi:O6-methylguanine-DNA--protein-cysteine methyltransferase